MEALTSLTSTEMAVGALEAQRGVKLDAVEGVSVSVRSVEEADACDRGRTLQVLEGRLWVRAKWGRPRALP